MTTNQFDPTNPEHKLLGELLAKREQHVNRLFAFMLEFLVIYGAPAAIAVLLARSLTNKCPGILEEPCGEEARVVYVIALGVAFVVSWGIFILRWRSLAKATRELQAKIDLERARLGVATPGAHRYPDEEAD